LKTERKEGNVAFEIGERKERETKVNYSNDVTVAPRDLFAAVEEVSDGLQEASHFGVHKRAHHKTVTQCPMVFIGLEFCTIFLVQTNLTI